MLHQATTGLPPHRALPGPSCQTGATLLFAAVQHGQLEVCRLLLDSGANLEAETAVGGLALEQAKKSAA